MSEKPKYKRYWVVPPIPRYPFEYQDIGKDKNLRNDVTNFFQKKLIKWINKYDNFSHLKSDILFFSSNEGKKRVYKLLRRFIKNSGINWFDLRDNCNLIKTYLRTRI
jgi:hypothetical protein